MRSQLRDVRDAMVEGDARERGVVLAFLAMVLFTLIVMAGLAVDVGNWWWTGQKVQKTADAAALGGVTFLPEDVSDTNPNSEARAMAYEIASRNGYTNGTNATIKVEVGDRPSRLRVTVTTETKNFFTGILGFKTTSIKRTAVADYTGSVPMGSPAGYLGQDPELGQTNPARLQKLWLNIAGRKTNKANGDRFTAGTCGNATTATPTPYQCADNSNGTNYENVGANGYRYVVRLEDGYSGGPLTIQAYDPAMIFTGDNCETNMPVKLPQDGNPGTTDEAGWLQSTYGGNSSYKAADGSNFYKDAATRYARAVDVNASATAQLWQGNDWCTGDQGLNGQDLTTTFTVYKPDSTPWTDLDNPVETACTAKSFRPLDTSGTGVFAYLNPDPAAPTYSTRYNTTDGQYLRANFHRWVTLCTVSSPEVGDYILKVSTYSSSTTTGGHNRFSLRAGGGTSAPFVDSDVRIFANGRLPIYVNSGAGNNLQPYFYVARVLPGSNGRTLLLEFFDIGDTSTGTIGLNVIGPTEYAAGLKNCTFQRDNGSSFSSPTCSVTGMKSSDYNGRLVSVTIPIPADYSCTVADPLGCWVQVRLTFDSGARPADTTTWAASIDGDPIRLVE